MTHCACRSRARTGHLTATGPVTPTCSHDRWGRAEAVRTALGEALALRRRTRVRFPPPPPGGLRRFRGAPSQNDEPPRTVRAGAVRHLMRCQAAWPTGRRSDGLLRCPRLVLTGLSYVRGRRARAVGRRCRYRRAGSGSLVTASAGVVLPVPALHVVAAWVVEGALPFLHHTPALVAIC
jgi:hypothetical protein